MSYENSRLQGQYRPSTGGGFNQGLLRGGGGLFGILGQETEFALHTPYAREIITYVTTSIQTLFHNIIEDTINNVMNMDESIESSLASNSTSPHPYNGLVFHIVYALTHQTIRSYKIEKLSSSDIDGKSIEHLVYVDVSGTKEEKDPDVLVIDGRNNKTYLLMEYYAILYEYMLFCMNSIKLANKPVYKLKNLRTENNKINDSSEIRQQTEHTLRALKRLNGFAIMDREDNIELIQNDVTKYKIMVDIAYGGISAVMSVPRSYLEKEVAAYLNGSGDGDRINLERTLEKTWNNFLEPIVNRIYDLVGFEKKYVYKEYLVGKLKGIADLLPVLEKTRLISDEQKQDIIKSLLQIKEENRGNNLNKIEEV